MVPGKKCILVVDDDFRVLRFSRLILQQAGYDVLTSTSGEEALKLVKSEPPAVVILDPLMQGTGGFETLRKLCEFAETPVIAFSTDDSAESEIMRLGAADFVSKPFSPDDLLSKVAAIAGTPSKE